MKPRSRWSVVLCLLAGIGVAPSLRADDKTEWVAPARAARKKNPIAADEKSIARGREVYARECASCHGDTGTGDGKAARDLERSPGDLTGPATQQQSDGALFWKTTEGKKPMPSFAKLLSDDDRWHVVNYMRTLAPKTPAATPPELAAPRDLRESLSKLFASYAKVASALAKDDSAGAKTAAESAKNDAEALAKVDAKSLDEKARTKWGEVLKALAARGADLANASDLATERERFKTFSESLASAVGAFGHAESAPLQLFRCSETNAMWLQVSREPANPYMGKSKPTCGALEKTLGAEREKDGKP